MRSTNFKPPESLQFLVPKCCPHQHPSNAYPDPRPGAGRAATPARPQRQRRRLLPRSCLLDRQAMGGSEKRRTRLQRRRVLRRRGDQPKKGKGRFKRGCSKKRGGGDSRIEGGCSLKNRIHDNGRRPFGSQGPCWERESAWGRSNSFPEILQKDLRVSQNRKVLDAQAASAYFVMSGTHTKNGKGSTKNGGFTFAVALDPLRNLQKAPGHNIFCVVDPEPVSSM